MSKTASPNPVQAGQDLTYVITVQNDGPGNATNVVVTDPFTATGNNALITTGGFQSATPSQGTCTPSARHQRADAHAVLQSRYARQRRERDGHRRRDARDRDDRQPHEHGDRHVARRR